MKAKFFLTVLPFILALLFSGTAAAADVAQGKCMQYDTSGKRIVLEEYNTELTKDHPYGESTGRVAVFDFANAKIGIPPEPGDILRIAYIVEDGAKRAIKVMNVSKQDLRKK